MEFKFWRVCTEHYLPVYCLFDVWRRYFLRTWLHFIVLYRRRVKDHVIYWVFDYPSLAATTYSFEQHSTTEFFRSSRFWQRRDVIYVYNTWSRWRYCVILILLRIDSLFVRKHRGHCAVSLHAVTAQQHRLPTVRTTSHACVSVRFVLGWVTTYNRLFSTWEMHCIFHVQV